MMKGSHRPLILASASERRRRLLAEAGFSFRVVVPDVDESPPEGVPPEEAAAAIAERKAESVASSLDDGIVIAADTIVVAGGEIIGKPADRADAIRILLKLSSRPHYVITGVCVLDVAGGGRLTGAERTRVVMRPMSREEIEAYVESGEAMDKAGAYAIQETGDRFVEKVEGSFTNVVGLPMELVKRLLDEVSGPDA